MGQVAHVTAAQINWYRPCGEIVRVLHLDPLAPRTPRLPHRRLGGLQLAAAFALHVSAVLVAALIENTPPSGIDARRVGPTTDQHLVFSPAGVAVEGQWRGWRRQSATGSHPARAGRRLGHNHSTRVPKGRPPRIPRRDSFRTCRRSAPPVPSIVLDAIPMASGLLNQIGLPTGGVMSGFSTGPGSGGGVGSGTGTGIGSGRGPGLGPGSGGGTGGGVFPPWRRGIRAAAGQGSQAEVPSEALQNGIQGTVVLEVIVAANGYASHVRIVRSLDRGGLDDEAVAAVAQWRFEPGRLAGAPVDVLVTIMVDFSLR